MRQSAAIRWLCVALCILLVCGALVSSAPAYNDYENLGDLYELLVQKEALDEQMNHPHQIVRKSNRLPTLRLRFGKKMDPYLRILRKVMQLRSLGGYGHVIAELGSMT